MKLSHPTALVIALVAAFPAAAQGSDELLKEVRALRDRIAELEKKLGSTPSAPAAAAPAAAPAAGQWGMTPEQARELNRIAIKTESLQDNFADQGFKGLKITGQMDPTYIYNKRQSNAGFVFLNNGGARYTYDNSYFGLALIDFDKETESGTKWKLTLAPERGTGSLINGGSIIHEASVSIPLSDLKTRLWLGQIPDWTGYELTMPVGNKLITHNLLFDFMAPTAYTGAVLDVASGKWWVRADYVNNTTNGGGLLGYSYDDGINGIGRGLLADGSFAKGDGTGTNRYALSLGMSYRVDENTVFKAEYRLDAASQPVFANPSASTFTKTNHLLGASMVVSF